MNIHQAGSVKISKGEYEEIKVSGSTKIEGPVRCQELWASGSLRAIDLLDCTGEIRASGSSRFDEVRAGNLKLSGASSARGDVKVQGEMRQSGAFSVGGSLSTEIVDTAGALSVAEDLEAGDCKLSGSVEVGGLINANTLKVHTGGNSSARAIGGETIDISWGTGLDKGDRLPVLSGNGKGAFVNAIKNLFSFFGSGGQFTVTESIEGDDITLENVVCPEVSGRVVKIGKGCQIGRVNYQESLEVSEDAQVDERVKQ
jgi:cytoskeletal protein CcmA (bactofilin family)